MNVNWIDVEVDSSKKSPSSPEKVKNSSGFIGECRVR
jgi:hypothetical protein